MAHKKLPRTIEQPRAQAFVNTLATDGIIQVIPEGSARKDKIVSMIINDVRSPLGAMAGLLNLLLRDPEKSLLPDQIALIEQALGVSRSLIRSSERLFHFYGARTFGLTPSSRFLDGCQLAQAAIKEARPLAQWHQVTLVNEIAEGVRLFVDPVLMQEVLLELLINAIRASTAYGQVVLSIAGHGGMDVVTVRDQGVGIPDHLLGKLFTEGAERADLPESDDRRKRGTGLGLPLAFRVVQAHDGTLEVESSVGKGSQFKIRLPRIRPKVLIVDDQKMDLDLLTLYLEPLNIEVIQAKSGPGALGALADGSREMRRGGGGFDLVVSDLNMPGMDGFELLEQIISDPNTATIPVILLTGESSMAQRVKGFRLGASDFVLKPVKAEEFRLCVRRLLGCLPEI